jgi:hypothetical protein
MKTKNIKKLPWQRIVLLVTLIFLATATVNCCRFSSVQAQIVETENLAYYLCNEEQTTNNATGYQLSTTNTAANVTLTDTAEGSAVTWGFRVFVIHWNGALTELTNAPVTVSRDSDGAGMQNVSWNAPDYVFDFGYDALQIQLYVRFDSGAWVLKGTFLTDNLVYKSIVEQTWTFTLYTAADFDGADITASCSFGDSTAASAVDNVGFIAPNQWDQQTYDMNQGNWLNFVFGSYEAQLGSATYVVLALIPSASLYLRYRSFGPVVFLFAIFGGSGGLIWLFIPPWAAAVTDALLLLGFAFIVWKVIR